MSKIPLPMGTWARVANESVGDVKLRHFLSQKQLISSKPHFRDWYGYSIVAPSYFWPAALSQILVVASAVDRLRWKTLVYFDNTSLLQILTEV